MWSFNKVLTNLILTILLTLLLLLTAFISYKYIAPKIWRRIKAAISFKNFSTKNKESVSAVHKEPASKVDTIHEN